MWFDQGHLPERSPSTLVYAWVIGAASAPLIALAQSQAQYPNIQPGADFDGYDT